MEPSYQQSVNHEENELSAEFSVITCLGNIREHNEKLSRLQEQQQTALVAISNEMKQTAGGMMDETKNEINKIKDDADAKINQIKRQHEEKFDALKQHAVAKATAVQQSFAPQFIDVTQQLHETKTKFLQVITRMHAQMHARPDLMKFDNWDSVTKYNLDDLTFDQIVRLTVFIPAVFQELYHPDDPSIVNTHTKDDMIAVLKNHTCKWCHSVHHDVANCHVLKAKTCKACGEKGHIDIYCRTPYGIIFTKMGFPAKKNAKKCRGCGNPNHSSMDCKVPFGKILKGRTTEPKPLFIKK
jgi:hypothetical protein